LATAYLVPCEATVGMGLQVQIYSYTGRQLMARKYNKFIPQ